MSSPASGQRQRVILFFGGTERSRRRFCLIPANRVNYELQALDQWYRRPAAFLPLMVVAVGPADLGRGNVTFTGKETSARISGKLDITILLYSRSLRFTPQRVTAPVT
jgi:hypothetical protein